MRKQTIARLMRLGAAALVASLLVGGIVSCENKDGRLVANRPPFVRLTGGPAEGDSVSYTSEFLWTGWDDDGIIDHYQYAIDIPDTLVDEIDNPAPTGIAWVDTTVFRASFLFEATVQDSVRGLPIEQFRGDHTFYVRSVDNEGAISAADFLTFTARTVTPKTTFTVPKQAGTSDVLYVGRQFNTTWTSIDPDNPDPSRRPAYYEWKLKQKEPTWNTSGQDAQYAVDYFARDVPWIRLGADTTTLRLSLQTGFPYIFAVRGVDEAGGVETRFFKGKNTVILFASEANIGTPALTITERSLGVVEFPGATATEFEVPLNQPLRFEFNADATAYGGIVQGYNYGVDIADVEVDGPASGFRGWTLNRFSDPITFTSIGTHTFTVKVRDTGGGVTIGGLILRVIPLTFDHEILLVDDFRRSRSQGVSDAMMDGRHRAMLQAAGFAPADIWELNPWGGQDEQADATVPRLSDLAPYKMIAWSVLGAGLSRNPALVQCNGCRTNRILQAYVGGGGALWVFGQYTFAGFKAVGAQTCLASLNYGFGDGGNPSHNFVAHEFLFEFMKIDGGGFLDAKNQVETHGLVRAVPTARAQAEGYPELNVDRTIFTLTNSGIPNCDAMFTPVFDNTGGLDTLYTYISNKGTAVTGFNGRPTALRYHDPDPSPDQGPVAVFGFPTHLLQNGVVTPTEKTGVKGMANLLVAWLKQHQTIAMAARQARP